MNKQQSKSNRNSWPPPRQHYAKNRTQKTYLYGDDDIYEQLEDQRRRMEGYIATPEPLPDDDQEPLVYIANVGMHDYSATFEWTPLGSAGVRKVTSGDIDRKNPERLVWNVVHGLRNFRRQDYFVFSGSPLPFAIGLSYLLRKHDAVQVLYYLKSKNAYFPIIYTWDMFERAEGIEFQTESIVPNNEDAEYPDYS